MTDEMDSKPEQKLVMGAAREEGALMVRSIQRLVDVLFARNLPQMTREQRLEIYAEFTTRELIEIQATLRTLLPLFPVVMVLLRERDAATTEQVYKEFELDVELRRERWEHLERVNGS